MKYFNTKKRKGWHAFVDWEGDWPASCHPFKDLFGSSCKYFGLVELIIMNVTNLKLYYSVEDAQRLKKEEQLLRARR